MVQDIYKELIPVNGSRKQDSAVGETELKWRLGKVLAHPEGSAGKNTVLAYFLWL